MFSCQTEGDPSFHHPPLQCPLNPPLHFTPRMRCVYNPFIKTQFIKHHTCILTLTAQPPNPMMSPFYNRPIVYGGAMAYQSHSANKVCSFSQSTFPISNLKIFVNFFKIHVLLQFNFLIFYPHLLFFYLFKLLQYRSGSGNSMQHNSRNKSEGSQHDQVFFQHFCFSISWLSNVCYLSGHNIGNYRCFLHEWPQNFTGLMPL